VAAGVAGPAGTAIAVAVLAAGEVETAGSADVVTAGVTATGVADTAVAGVATDGA